ncbi:Arc family DNA-binding protein [Achromobacter sp. GD03932]|uniref:Arc family DNA-binding protein n=1 Tax=Achromobacter sp. GD03932 TaxID=2975407 RepID=UPI002448137A|nr:Arc family DNA-binding protein [Achromobacter sp. GD03932]MDH1299670.1 Arc family DNA-binding protein [Achromobacter sp. GD03932]
MNDRHNQKSYPLRLPADLRDRLEAAAAKGGRSLNSEINIRLEHSFTPWAERPWEERMVTDVNRAMLKLLTKEEYGILLDRVKAAGGADTVNGYRAAIIRSDEDLQPPIPDGPRLQKLVEDLPPPVSEADAMARQLALAVLKITGKYQTKDRVLNGPPGSGKTKMLEPLLDSLDAAPRAKKPRAPKQQVSKKRVVEE